MVNLIKTRIKESIGLKVAFLTDDAQIETISLIISNIIACYKQGGKVLWCGNGGSAADAQHLAAELSGRYYLDRPPLFSEALHVNSSYITAVANDYSFGSVYSRYVCAAGRAGDVLIGLSTSGSSTNVANALYEGKKIGMTTIGLIGNKTNGPFYKHCKFIVSVPSSDTPRIQECHMMIGHIICEQVEKSLFGGNNTV